ncbi:SCO2524 family protein [Actinocorallia lasiicapitis]
MRIQPREQLLNIWRSAVESAMQDGKWTWGGRNEPNSISDAEQLLTIMYPAADVPIFKVDQPDQTADDVLVALQGFGDELEIPQVITDILIEYIDNYTIGGTPYFSGGSYFQTADPDKDPTAQQQNLDVVDSFSMSITLMLNTIGFVRVFRGAVRNVDLLEKLSYLEDIASKRLTAAMVGLLRSFVVNVFTPESSEGQALIRSVNQYGDSPRHVVEDLYKELEDVRASVRDYFTIGSGQTSQLDNRNRLFELGWSWGVVKDAPEIEIGSDIGDQRRGYAQGVPFLYFTVNALDGIADLSSSRTVVLGLLNEEQQRLASALRLRWELTQRYWATIATFGDGRWPLEDIPWKTTDGRESDYYSLLVTSMVVQDLESRRASDDELRRLRLILEELAQRGRITRRSATNSDWGVRFHAPGSNMRLIGSEHVDNGPRLLWQVTDYSAVILKRTLRLAAMARSTELRDDLIEFADQVWTEHLERRRMQSGQGKGLWDEPANIYEGVDRSPEQPSWYYTERIVECMVFAANLVSAPPPRSNSLISHARELLNEANNLFDNEVLNSPIIARGQLRNDLDQAQAMLLRARGILYDRPGTSAATAQEVLRILDKLAVARRKAEEGAS